MQTFVNHTALSVCFTLALLSPLMSKSYIEFSLLNECLSVCVFVCQSKALILDLSSLSADTEEV